MNVVLGVSGGIAAYKSPEIVRRLKDAGHAVRVVTTAGAEAFVSPLTFQAVSGEPVHRDLLDETAEAAMGHIELARWADVVLIAPATANVMARLAHGFADDLLTTLCLATAAPLVIAPAMNRQMWRASATRANLEALLARGVRAIGPDAGWQACGDVGPGRMSEPADLVAALLGDLPPAASGPSPASPTGGTFADFGYTVAGAADSGASPLGAHGSSSGEPGAGRHGGRTRSVSTTAAPPGRRDPGAAVSAADRAGRNGPGDRAWSRRRLAGSGSS